MKKAVFIVLVFITALAVSCSSKLSEAEYYTKANELYGNQQYEEAIQNFQAIIDNYPEGQHYPTAIFMTGYIYANHMQNFDEAKKYYSQFLEKFPEHELAVSAKYEIENLGKDINELPIFKELTADSTAEAQTN